MRVTLFPCGPAANESEIKGFEHLKSRLQSEAGNEEWILLANLAFSVNHQLQSDEIDLVVIGPYGATVIEIKHWTSQWFDANTTKVEMEAERVTNKARKIGTTLRGILPNLPHVTGAILLTQEPSKVKRIDGKHVRGIGIYTLNSWKKAVGFDLPPLLSTNEIKRLAHTLQPRSIIATDGSLRRLAGYVNLELQTPKEQRFHRIYKGSHPARRDRVLLHLYDLSATEDRNADVKAKREFETLHRLQLYPWAPRILDSFQEAPEYAGEMFFFTVVDPLAPSLKERSADKTWSVEGRITFARNTVQALVSLHAAGTVNEPIVHRNLTPQTILIKHDNTPILTGYEYTKIPSEVSVASRGLTSGRSSTADAPEVQISGLAAADQRSDLYSLSMCLNYLFEGQVDRLAQQASQIISQGLHQNPAKRGSLSDIEAALSKLLGESVLPPPPPPSRFWTEDQIIRFRDHNYRIVSKLGSGGIGTTFKVVEIDRSTEEDIGTYVAKVVHDGETGERVLRAYRLVKSYLRDRALSTIFEVASQWQENEFVALLSWISGTPLAEFTGVFPLLAEEHQELSSEALALRWLRIICEGLGILHQNNLIHGDISPRNLIVSGSSLVLTDYDFVMKIGESVAASGTFRYCSPSYQERRLASASDDLYALAASFFHVVFDKEPFQYDGNIDKTRGLNWENIDREEHKILAKFLDRATDPDPQRRFTNTSEALKALAQEQVVTPTVKSDMPLDAGTIVTTPELGKTSHQQPMLSEQRVDWVLSLLESYPGSRWGNRETRGLDTDFAAHTYVETLLEETLLQDIRERNVRLVILCGNAGDGKTALLQHLSSRLGLGEHKSVKRILEGEVFDGPLVRMNLDGSASWENRSADELLDEFLEPFQDGCPTEDIVHLLAINDGRLLEWIEGVEQRRGRRTSLTIDLHELLQYENVDQKAHVRFVSLNQRSLVGNVLRDSKTIDTTFLNKLIDQLYGGEQASEIWLPCQTCSAKTYCEIYRSAQIFGPDTIPIPTINRGNRSRARERLFQALQAVHLSGETHITMRELRAALVYIMFGVHFCEDYHKLTQDSLPYWDRAFDPNSLNRQGDVLNELIRFDPALDAHPKIDRYLLSQPIESHNANVARYPDLSLESARRRAFFEWTVQDIQQVAEAEDALDLARGQHLRDFRDLPLVDDSKLVELCKRLCRGISRLEDLPPQALDQPNVISLRITPRTPTETAFWVEKPLNAFRLEADLRYGSDGIEILHRQAFLIYLYRDKNREERLRLGAQLFHLLLELEGGYQLGDVSSDDTFAHLSIFIQRLVREDEHELLAWSPMQDETIYGVKAILNGNAGTSIQQMIIAPRTFGETR